MISMVSKNTEYKMYIRNTDWFEMIQKCVCWHVWRVYNVQCIALFAFTVIPILFQRIQMENKYFRIEISI